MFTKKSLHFLAFILLTLLLTTQIFAQEDADARLQFFEGGNLNGTLMLRSCLVIGPGNYAAFSGMTAPAIPEAFVAFGNPAALGRMKGDQLSISMSPKIDLEVENFTSSASESIEEEVDNALDAFARTGPFTYPEVTGTVGRAGTAMGGLALCFAFDEKTDKWFGKIPRLLDRFAFAYYQSLYLSMDVAYSGLRMRLRTIEETPESEILFYSSVKMNVDLVLTADNWVLAGAKKFGKFNVGLGLTRTDIGIDLTAMQKTDAILSISGTESAFDDPNKPWDNQYFNSSIGSLKGVSWGLRAGATWQPKKWLLLGSDFSFQAASELEGPLDIQMHVFQALNLNAAEGDKSFDVNLIPPDEPTRTVTKEFIVAKPPKVQIPGSINLGLTFLVAATPCLTFSKYFGELAYTMDLLEDGAPFTYQRGVKPNWSGLLGINLKGFRISAGAVQIADVVDGYRNADGVPIPEGESMILPQFSMGFDIKMNKSMKVNLLLVGLPEDAARVSWIFQF